ncbi:MAG: aspartyl protease family protein, partial [Candidatus Thorarchaeota archaeon]
ETSIDFVMKDPLPIVTLKVNEKERCNFLIDTGAASVILEEDFASEIGIESSDSFEGTFLGGKKAPVKQGFLESITLNEITVTNVPVDILKLKLVGMDIKGIIGTVLFYHFLTTLDYPNDKLILRRKDGKYKPKIKHSEKVYRMPIWMAGSHYAVAWGQVNEGPPNLLFVDTGGGGVGIMCSDRTIEEAGINLPDNEGREAMGGGGMAQVVPFNIEKASLGQAMRENVQGIYTKNFPLENAFGFHIGGIVSHQFLKAYSVTFDYDKMELILDP